MARKTEKLGDQAMVKGTMLEAHLAWAQEQLGELTVRLGSRLSPESLRLVSGNNLATEWYPLRCLIEIDRAVAATLGGDPEELYREMGRHSAARNLSGVYKSFVVQMPHRFFEQMTLLHRRFLNFGDSRYEPKGDRSGEIYLEGYDEYSPVFCTSGLGYYEEALRMMKAPGPIEVSERACQCAGDPACIFSLSW